MLRISSARREGQWSFWTLLIRQINIFFADRWNSALFFLQPVLIGLLISVVADDPGAVPRKLFLGYTAALWLGCSNAAQMIVRERPIFLRERLAGMRLNNYLAAKFACVGGFAAIQSGIIYSLCKFLGSGLIGSVYWQLVAVIAGSVTMSGVGILISALSRTTTQAVMTVPLVIIPQILLAGHVFPLDAWKEDKWSSNAAKVLSGLCPSFASQRLVDLSLFWDHALNDAVDESGTTFNRRYQLDSNFCNLEMATVPWRTWMLGDRSQTADLAMYGMAHSRVKDYSEWPESYPSPARDKRFRVWQVALQPCYLLLVVYVMSYIISLRKLTVMNADE